MLPSDMATLIIPSGICCKRRCFAHPGDTLYPCAAGKPPVQPNLELCHDQPGRDRQIQPYDSAQAPDDSTSP